VRGLHLAPSCSELLCGSAAVQVPVRSLQVLSNMAVQTEDVTISTALRGMQERLPELGVRLPVASGLPIP